MNALDTSWASEREEEHLDYYILFSGLFRNIA